MNDIDELKRQGLSIRAISRVTGYYRNTISKYLKGPKLKPTYGRKALTRLPIRPRPGAAGKLEPFKDYLKGRLTAGVWDLGRAYREGRLDRRMRVHLAPKVIIINETGIYRWMIWEPL